MNRQFHTFPLLLLSGPQWARRLLVALAIPALATSTLARAETAACVAGSEARVQVAAVFTEGAPTDKLDIRNQSVADWRIERVVWNLEPSRGRLIFDVTDAGAGVQVFQPLRVLTAASPLMQWRALPRVNDGEQRLELRFDAFAPGETFSIAMDLDDQIGARETIVSGSEIEAAVLQVSLQSASRATAQSLVLTFDGSGRAVACLGL